MAENPKLEFEGSGLEDKMGTQKITVSDHMNGLPADKSDDLVIDMESFSHLVPPPCKDINSRITLQRSLSRKGSQRVGEDKVISNPSAADKNDSQPGIVLATSSPRGTPRGTPRASLLGSNSMDTATMAAIGTTDHTSKLQNHHQITVTTGSIGTANESRFTIRRNSFRRSSSSWILDPKRILFIFATLSSMGTILLIYFTLSISKSSTAGGDFDLPQ
ncbi:uncharacterized protein LOC120286020 isoform X1 [Eucalyptus grandis]|uniref:uncharacterized protein LOC120286020 isoform X1 n=2 Tax=Eucalyptus grandis TaxID=71139 RepID=UPI00192EB533|nr:uncharacterized protein LOC120286020 isoform X1 [Eucalyptus grandis]